MPYSIHKTASYLLSVGLLFSTGAYASPDTLSYKIEAKAHYRVSDDVRFPVQFPPDASLATVQEGGHVEVSNIAGHVKWQASENLQLIGKVDLIQLYERNPTSSDKIADIDMLLARYGTKHTHGRLPEHMTAYVQLGKFGKAERQEDRHLESYGLVSTAFNRLEDAGLEAGIDFSSGVYAKLSYMRGTPLFFRDPNALAGDNGVFKDPDPDILSGFPMLYDAEVDDFNITKAPETGLALGYRWLSDDGLARLNLMAFHYDKDLEDSVALHGTAYGGDLDLLSVDPDELPPGTISESVGLDFDGNKKTESGVNLWWYGEHSALFLQYVEQDIAGLKRHGTELEWSYVFDGVWGDKRVVPVFRWSNLHNKFGGPALFPAPSIWWDWTKVDVGVNVDLNRAWRLTLEYAQTTFVRAGRDEDNNELLLTVQWQWGQ